MKYSLSYVLSVSSPSSKTYSSDTEVLVFVEGGDSEEIKMMGWEIERVLGPAPFLLPPPLPLPLPLLPSLSPPQQKKNSESFSPETHLTNDFFFFFYQTQEELSAMKEKHEQERKDEVVENVATVLLEYDGTGSDKDLISALDQKYDALKDKLLLEAIKKQLGKGVVV